MQFFLLAVILPIVVFGAPISIRQDTTLLNRILVAVGNLPGVGESVTAISGVLTSFEAGLATTLKVDTSEDNTACAAMTVIFARGTTEPGNVGILTGPPFFDALQSMMGNKAVAVQGVNYPASIEGFLKGGDATGSQTMANMVTSTLKQCPSTALVMSGYSQGGQLVHNAAKLLPASTMAKVSSVVIFGDPDNGEAVQGAAASKTLVICDKADNICAHGDLILPAHLLYSRNAAQAASFVTTNAGLALGSSKYANSTTI